MVMHTGDVVGGRFELHEVAGTGGMGMVFRARDRETGDLVALKVLGGASDDRQRFAREITHLAAITHPRVVRFVTHGITTDDEPYLVMEWVEGESLQHRLEHAGLTLAEAIAVGIQVADALGEIHQRGLVHRDLKPANLMFERGDLAHLKLIDFGIARALTDGNGLTLTGMLVGTPGYMSPEQARGIRDVDARADAFSFGCVLYECITGWNAFAGEHSMAVRAKILFADPAPLQRLSPEVPVDLAALVDRLLSKRVEERPRDGREIAQALRSLGPMPATAARPTVGEEIHTVALRGTPRRQDFVVLAGYPGQLDGTGDGDTIPASALRAITDAVFKIDPAIRIERIAGGAVVVQVPGSSGEAAPRERAALAGRCAQECRRALPTIPIAILAVTQAPVIARGERDAIDRAVDALFKATLRAPGRPAVWIDDETRALIGNPLG